MKQLIEKLEKENLSFQLSKEQRETLINLINFIASDNKTCSISGPAGTGKSSIVKIITRFLEYVNKNYILATPTHKSRSVLSIYTDRDSTTLHKLLSLKPTIDIMELDFKDLKFSSDTSVTGIPHKGIIIIDECSMINDVLYDFIVKRAEANESKVLFLGGKLPILIKLTGNSLELFLLTYNSDIYEGVANHNEIVKKKKIGQSAAKCLK